MSVRFLPTFHNGYRNLSQLTQPALVMPTAYKDAIEALNKLQSNAQYINHAKIKNNPENNKSEMAKFLRRSGLSFEQLDTLPIIHVTGTNGKGSTCSYTENILRRHGYKTGFYSSPHLLEVRERIRLNGVPLSQEKFAEYFWMIYRRLENEKSASYDMPLYFRFLTLMAFHVFLREKVDVAILEVGIGGEYDCTNIVRKTLVAGITPLDIDHTVLLGNSLESIAWHKAGIMKPGAQVFTVRQPECALEVFRAKSVERQCTLDEIEDFYINDTMPRTPSSVQRTNASLALAISRAFISTNRQNRGNYKKNFDIALAKRSIEATKWPGRYEIIRRNNTVFYLDGAHTVESVQVCSEWFLSQTIAGRERVLMFNVTGEREAENLLKLLLKCRFDGVIFLPNVGDDDDNADTTDVVQPTNRQLERCKSNAEIWKALSPGSSTTSTVEVFSSFAKALASLENRPDKKKYDVLVTGSIHLIGAAMSVLDPTFDGLL